MHGTTRRVESTGTRGWEVVRDVRKEIIAMLSPDIVSLLIGSILGLLLSFAGTLFAHYLQLNRDKRQRLWDLEDRKLEIKAQRIKKIEEYANLHLEIATKLVEMRKVLGFKPVSLDIFKKDLLEVEALMNRKFQLASNTATIKDASLGESLAKLTNTVSDEYSKVMELYIKIIQGNWQNADNEKGIQEVLDFLVKVKSFHAETINRLDQVWVK
jgi:hypothetical protein